MKFKKIVSVGMICTMLIGSMVPVAIAEDVGGNVARNYDDYIVDTTNDNLLGYYNQTPSENSKMVYQETQPLLILIQMCIKEPGEHQIVTTQVP